MRRCKRTWAAAAVLAATPGERGLAALMIDSEQRGVDSNPRVVLLGASNLTRSISTAVATAQLHFGRQLEVLVASGHGRSYGLKSWFLGRSLPPILECRLWNDLALRSNVPTTAMMTDIGNDILFNVPVPVIAAWIETVLDRLEQANSRVSHDPFAGDQRGQGRRVSLPIFSPPVRARLPIEPGRSASSGARIDAAVEGARTARETCN